MRRGRPGVDDPGRCDRNAVIVVKRDHKRKINAFVARIESLEYK